jgi:rhomboid protease GluP
MTDPIHTLSHRTSDLPLRSKVPYASYSLVAANVAVLVLTKVAGQGLEERVLDRLAQDRLAVWSGDWWRLFTAMFIHDGWAHLALNMLLLVTAGGSVERLLGPLRFLVLYLVSGLSGALFFQAFAVGKIGIGASGAIVGVFGAYVVAWAAATSKDRRAAGWKFLRWAAFLLLADFAYASLMELTAGVLVASSAHAGGFVAGAFLAVVFAIGVNDARPRPVSRLAALAGLVCVVAGVAAHAFLRAEPPRWPELELAEKIEKIRSGSAEAALGAWKELDLEGAAKREAGHHVWVLLMSEGQRVLADSVLDELIASAEAEWEARVKKEEGVTPDLANELAWYLALRGMDLRRAFALADGAVGALRHRMGWLSELLGGARTLSMCINTRGWVRFLLGEHEAGLRDLREAADLCPMGPNLLYLAIAHEGLGNVREAREAGRLAREAGRELNPYEKRLLEELEEDLGGF